MPGMPPLAPSELPLKISNCAGGGGCEEDVEASSEAAEPLSVWGEVSSGEGCTLLP